VANTERWSREKTTLLLSALADSGHVTASCHSAASASREEALHQLQQF